MIAKSSKVRVLQLGTDWTGLNDDLIKSFKSDFEVIPVSSADLQRKTFINNLQSGKWGNFRAIIRPVVYQGAETEPWNDDIISILPKSLQVYASVGAGYDWMDIPLMTKRGSSCLFGVTPYPLPLMPLIAHRYVHKTSYVYPAVCAYIVKSCKVKG